MWKIVERFKASVLYILDVDPRNVRGKKIFIVVKNTISLLRTQMIKLKAND